MATSSPKMETEMPSSISKKRSMGLMTSFSARNRPNEKKPDGYKHSGRTWKRLICGARPLHHIEGPLTPRPTKDRYHDVSLPPQSPTGSVTSSLSSLSSRYASALDLQTLDNTNIIINDNGGEIKTNGDEDPNLIDMQAEQYISKFYEEMKLQRMESMDGS